VGQRFHEDRESGARNSPNVTLDMKGFMATVVFLPSLCVGSAALSSQVPMPPGIAIQITIDGPVFVDSRGMTLYRVSADPLEPCGNMSDAVLLNPAEASRGLTATAPDSKTRRTCLQKYPSLHAPTDGKPIGKWSVYMRDDGSRQWAYGGAPLYTSIKDKAPGEINGSIPGATHDVPASRWAIALAPLPAAPPEITVRKTAVGLALANHTGKTLYYRDRDEAATGPALWRPLAAPVLAIPDRLPDWSIVTRVDGLRQWAYKGRPLYTYADDSEDDRNQFFGDIFGSPYGQAVPGWHVAVLKAAPSHPAEVSVHTIVDGIAEHHNLEKRVYTNTRGMTLYVISCVENTAEHLSCDDVGDSPRYWLSFCGGEERCARTWHPLTAPSGAQSIDNIWSTTTINPRHPWRAIDRGQQGLRVWAYRGMPVFTYAHDFKPGDYNGNNWLPEAGMHAQPILAYQAE
jgi:predicted lipoprotein with Yx(FWY)xxD motif